MEQQSSEKLPMDDHPSEYLVVEGFQMTMAPSKSKPPQQQRRRPEYFPVVFDVQFLHPSPNPKNTVYNLLRYKTQYEFWVNCDDFSSPESGVAAVNGFVDLMNVPFPLRDVQLFWKTFKFDGKNKSECKINVADWDSMAVILFRFLRDVKDFVGKQGDENPYPLVKLGISKFVKLTREEFNVAWLAREREKANGGGAWSQHFLRRPHQMEMEWRMAVLLAKGIERVKFGGGEKECCCGICLTDMSVGSAVARLPCSHLAHERCILNWLGINNSCPYCRFKISAIEGKTRPTPDNYWNAIY